MIFLAAWFLVERFPSPISELSRRLGFLLSTQPVRNGSTGSIRQTIYKLAAYMPKRNQELIVKRYQKLVWLLKSQYRLNSRIYARATLRLVGVEEIG